MDNIKIYENSLDEELRNYLYLDSILKIKNPDFYGWKTNYSWHSGIIGSSHVALSRAYDLDTKILILNNLIKNNIIPESDPINYAVLNYAWTKLSYIPWHNDSNSKQTITIYLNDNWDEDWGGLFLYKDNGEIKGISPKPNRCVKNTGDLMHTVTPVYLNAPGCRVTVQIFSDVI